MIDQRTVFKNSTDGGDLFADVAKMLREKSWPVTSLRTLDALRQRGLISAATSAAAGRS